MSELTELCDQVRVCQKCDLSKGRTNAVPGEGPENAQVMFIGEAPGFHEDRQGRPFVGAAGQYLDELLGLIEMKREQVYICNVIKCFISPRVLIYTAEGYKPIKDIRLGDLVLTHRGQFRRVCFIRPREILPEGSDVVEFTVRAQGSTSKPLRMTVTPEHPFWVNGCWTRAAALRAGDLIQTLGDRCEVCGKEYLVRHDRYDRRTFHTCSPTCHNQRVLHSPETREKIRRVMREQYADGTRDPRTIVARAHQRTRELVAAGQAKIQRMTAEERYRGRIAIAQNITAGRGKHRVGFGEEELKAILDRLGIEYVHHFAFPGSAFTFDFCLLHEQILIEVRGPGFSISKEIQQRAMAKEELADQHGYLVLNLWYAQVIKHPQMAESIIRRLLKNHRGEFVFVNAEITEVRQRQTRRAFPLYNIGVEGDESYIADGVVSHNCRPPQNRDPLPEEMDACRPYIDRQLALIKPKVVITISRFAMARWFPEKKISDIHGKPKKFGNLVILPMYHPAAALHQPSLKRVVEEDFKRVPQILREMANLQEDPEEKKTPPPQQLSMF